MRRYKISNFLSEAFKGIFRNGLMSAISVLILISTLLVMGCFWILNENISYNLSLMDDMREIRVYMSVNADGDMIENARYKISDYIGVSVASIELIPKDVALEAQKSNYDEKYAEIIDSFSGEANPLPDAFSFSYPESIDDIEYRIQLIKGIEGVDSVSNRKEDADRIDDLKNVISNISLGLMAMLFLVSIFVIGNTVKLTHEARKDDIRIMRYMGATNFYISAPFILEGVIIGLFSGGIAYFIQKFVYSAVVDVITANYGNIVKLLSMGETPKAIFGIPNSLSYDMIILIAFLVIGFLTGILGTLTTRKHLKA